MTIRKKVSDPPGHELSFEMALERLEKIVEQMESAELPLEEVLKQYEEGTGLVKFCAQKLEEAEKKVELLSKKKDGSPRLTTFTTEAQPEPPSDSPAPETKEDKLF
jgi:exodeoxyribonuclease VII small subunit